VEPNYKGQFNALIDDYLAGHLGFDAFQEAYSRCFIDKMPDGAVTKQELELYGLVHEKAEWTSPAPSQEERKHGWMDVRAFTDWLREHRRRLTAS
jgi:hypothetical protein